MTRRRHRGHPVWDRLIWPTRTAPACPPEPARRRGAILTGFAIAGSLAILWKLVETSGHQGLLSPAMHQAPSPVIDVVIARPEPLPDLQASYVPTDMVARIARIAPTARMASVGTLSAGATGGSGRGSPGLDLGLASGEGGGNLLVAAGGGGFGSGRGSGTGDGTGTGDGQVVYQPGQTDTEPRARSQPDPVYPRRARDEGVEATVELRLLIDARGFVREVEVLGAPPGYGFERAVEQVVPRWRFEPAVLGGAPVATWARMRYVFRLEGGP